ncbi:hypothetical protein RHS01_09591 [Rhizoctonia solani]|uniref:Reverse transcriptase n=1 Tax=Rhizoctonia solani TaxID=456999 RepID=A0A8H7I8S9_9AGAM|nr:hypothetical protein RHS01_09591 [Rhizoctonia solani]
MDLPDPYKGDTRGQKATQWLDQMMLWVALHCDQFDEEEQMVVWILYHMTDKAADWALPIIGNIIKGKGGLRRIPMPNGLPPEKIAALSQSTTTSKYVTEFCNLMAELDWNEEAYIAQFTRGLHWKVKELLSTKDSIPDNLEAIFAAAIKIDNIRRKNEENRPKKVPAKSRPLRPPLPLPPLGSAIRRPKLCHSGRTGPPPRVWPLCQVRPKGTWHQTVPNGWKATIKEVAKVAEEELEKSKVKDCCQAPTQKLDNLDSVEFVSLALDSNKKPLLFIDLYAQKFPAEPLKTLIDSGATSNFISPLIVEKYKIQKPNSKIHKPCPGAKLSPGPIYGMTNAESKALKQHIEEELATGKIRPSTSSAGAPVMFVKKADGSLRLVVDYRKLNDITHKNVYPLPRQDDLMAKLRHAKIFTKLDLRWGYNNVWIKEGDEWKTLLGQTAFQHFMNDLFRDLIDVTVVVYLDDILIFSEDPKDHPTMSGKSSTVDEESVVLHFPGRFFHGPEEDQGGHVMANPKTVKQVQAFLGFVNYLRRFIPNFSSVACPLHNLTKKETPWSWGDQEEAAFQELKVLVTKSPVLIHSNPGLPYYLETDASGVAMGAILSQRGSDNQLHPIAYMSKLFSGAEANYNTHNKELLAIIKALEEWRIFLEATDKPVQVFTDHRNLEYWMQARTFNQRHARWRVFLSDFNFEIHYCPGKQSGKLDALSRRSDYVDNPRNQKDCHGDLHQTQEDPSLEPIIKFLTEDVDNAPPSIRKAYRDYDWEEDLLWYRGKLVVPDSEPLKEQLLREFHNSPLQDTQANKGRSNLSAGAIGGPE